MRRTGGFWDSVGCLWLLDVGSLWNIHESTKDAIFVRHDGRIEYMKMEVGRVGVWGKHFTLWRPFYGRM